MSRLEAKENPEKWEEEDAFICIEELKSENPNLKHNAACRIVNVSKVLGTLQQIDPPIFDVRAQAYSGGIHSIYRRHHRRSGERR